MAVTVTVDTNSYISVADAELYFNDRLYVADWTAASADDKARAVIMATRKLDRLALKGRKKTTTQLLEFPRCYVYDTRYPVDGVAYTLLDEGWYCESDVPQAILDAVCEEALALLESGNDSRAVLQRAGVVSYSLGSLSETFGPTASNPTASKTRGLISDEAKALMRPYLAGAVLIS